MKRLIDETFSLLCQSNCFQKNVLVSSKAKRMLICCHRVEMLIRRFLLELSFFQRRELSSRFQAVRDLDLIEQNSVYTL